MPYAVGYSPAGGGFWIMTKTGVVWGNSPRALRYSSWDEAKEVADTENAADEHIGRTGPEWEVIEVAE